jgi:hypothetical protein
MGMHVKLGGDVIRKRGATHSVVGIWNVEIMDENDVRVLEEPIAAAMKCWQYG